MRRYTLRANPPFTMIGANVDLVEESKDPNFPKGAHVQTAVGWVERMVVNPTIENQTTPHGKLGEIVLVPDIGSLSMSHLLGACGMPGNTAYFGLMEVGRPNPGETVVVSGAAGAVGSLVGQLAKIWGCKVVGFAGTEEKCAWLKDIGYDHVFNYKTTGVAGALKEAAPEGVDCYFDNVGGEMSAAVMDAMNKGGRVAVCGAISQYNGSTRSKVTAPAPRRDIMVEGFHVSRWGGKRWWEGVKAMSGYLTNGQVETKETIL